MFVGRSMVSGLWLALVLVSAWACSAHAATFTVDRTTDDTGPCPAPATCSLRQAIESANATAGTDVIEFALPPASVISLTDGPLEVLPDEGTDALAIRGPGAALLTVRPDPLAPPAPIFSLPPVGRGVTLSGFTIAGGVGVPATGAAINSGAKLVLDRMRISDNTVDAEDFGAGGGIVVGGDTTIRSSTFDANTVTNSGFAQSGGAIVNFGRLHVVNSTFSGNHVTGAGPAGAIWNTEELSVVGTTISGNSVVAGGGGILNNGQVEIANSILAGNVNAGAPDCGGTLGSQGYNIVGDATGCTLVGGAGDQVGTAAAPLNPLLGPLASNGGPTPTMALLAGSPAREAGNPAPPADAVAPLPPDLTPCPLTDQRGIVRPAGARCDIGAFEVVPAPPPPAPPQPPPAPPPLPPPPFVAPPVDHYKCYEASDATFRPRSVLVRDQFAARARTARLRKTTTVCNPARKNGSALLQPKAHLVCYQSRDVAPFGARSVTVTNQFGARTLRVVKPVSLCVPSLKREGGQAPRTSPNVERRLDHFRCYAVDPKLTPRNVTTSDQFVTTRTQVVSVVRLCNPVSKNGGAVRRPLAHLVCYSIRDRAPDKIRGITVRNQFGVARVRTNRARSLCLPSLKRELTATGAQARARYAWTVFTR